MNKKFFFTVLFSLLLSSLINANDAYIEAAGGSVLPIDSPHASAHPYISMKSEVIKIDLEKDFYRVHVDFVFYNEGDSVKVKVGFPKWHYGSSKTIEMRNFKTSVNGKTVDYEIIEDKGAETPLHKSDVVDSWFVREITFPSKTTTKTSVDYDCEYGHAGFNKGVEYLFGTGKTWKNPIGSQTIEITNNIGPSSIILDDRTFFIESDEWKKAEALSDAEIENIDDKIIITRKNLSPDFFDKFRLEIADDYYTLYPYADLSEDNFRLGKYRLTARDLLFFTKEQLRYMRNMIFAWHGNIFQSADLKQWLKGMDWYKPSHKVDLSELSDIELENVQTIQIEEARRK
ncbi:MAG: YARHG domain-containing protein [Treponemataceae bacterium]|nr:YARHG domain-containing protein [Treponemataceae bacterium]